MIFAKIIEILVCAVVLIVFSTFYYGRKHKRWQFFKSVYGQLFVLIGIFVGIVGMVMICRWLEMA